MICVSLVKAENANSFKLPLRSSMVVLHSLGLWEHAAEVQSCEGSETLILAKHCAYEM